MGQVARDLDCVKCDGNSTASYGTPDSSSSDLAELYKS